jgi:DNA-directed RNA polymerase specialized sigma24 family protein
MWLADPGDRLLNLDLLLSNGRTEKNVATILGVSDRTVRNRLHKALNLLRSVIETEGKAIRG